MTSAGEVTQAAGEIEQAAQLEFSIVMPCLNEAASVGVCIEKARASLDKAGIAGEIIVADNGSTDDSRLIATDLGARVVPVAARGYGNALAVGIEAITVSLDGNPDKLDDFEDLLRSYGIVELQRTGRVALPKLEREARLRAVKGKAV